MAKQTSQGNKTIAKDEKREAFEKVVYKLKCDNKLSNVEIIKAAIKKTGVKNLPASFENYPGQRVNGICAQFEAH